MRGGGVRIVVMLVGLAALLPAATASASSVTNIGSFSDPRGDLPVRPGQLVRALYGPFTVPANGQIHNVPLSVPAPCSTDCAITDMVPNLVYDSNGATANMQDGMLLHHFVLFNPAQQGIGCPLSEPFFGAGNERTHLHLPTPYGYENTSTNWNMITHLVNTSNVARTVNVEIIFRHRPLSATEPARPAWLDIDSICSGGNSEYTIPVGYSDTHVDWTVPQNARIIGMSGHLHDIDIIDPSPCPVHCSSHGEAIALTAELLGGSAGDYFGPVPPNNPPPADITGATLCRSEAYHGTAFGTAIGANGHMDTTSHCGIFSHLPAGAQAEAYPSAGAYSFEGYPIKAGQVIRLHSEYQNNSGAPKTDVMGIMGPWLAFPDPGYPRPVGATPMRASLVPAYNQCTSPNRVHGPPDFPGGTNPDGSCNPPAQTSGQITVGTPDANGAGANSVGSVRMSVINGNPATTADEANVRYTVSITDVRCKPGAGACGAANAAGGADYSGQVQARTGLRITDRYNGPSEVGTGQDTSFGVTVPCAGTASTAVGSACSIDTTADAVLPGVVKEVRRSIWQLGQVQVFDGGADGVVSTTPNTLFAVQGIFVP
jgi:hypothetical protein